MDGRASYYIYTTNNRNSIIVRVRRDFKVDLKEWYKFHLNLRV